MKNTVLNTDCISAIKALPANSYDVGFADCPQAWKNDQKKRGEFFYHLRRATKKQMVFGYQFYAYLLHNHGSIIVWDKGEMLKSKPFDECLIIWYSENVCTRVVHFNPFFAGKPIHKSEKPIQLYRWILNFYLEEGESVLDAHVGSGTLRLASAERGIDYLGYELDKEIYNRQEARYNNYKRSK